MTEKYDRMRAPAWGAPPVPGMYVPHGDGIPETRVIKGSWREEELEGVHSDDIEVGPYGISYVYRMKGHLSAALYHNAASARAASILPQMVTSKGLVPVQDA